MEQSHTLTARSSSATKVVTFLLNNSTLIVFILMLVIAGFLSDRFYSGDNITNVLRQSVP